MSQSGPIILVDDDSDDHQTFKEALSELGVTNAFITFDTAADAMHYLRTTSDKPFVIFCDVNMPAQTGIEFKRSIDSDKILRRKSIPFVFMATVAEQAVVDEAFETMTIQGFFKKPVSLAEIKILIMHVLSYWFMCMHPNNQ